MWLEVLSGEDAGRVVEVDRALVLGRVQGADVVIRDARASRRHAEVAPESGGLRLRDLGSANGTLVDGDPADEVLLTGGEELSIGGVRIAVLTAEPPVTGAPIAEPVRPGVRLETEGPSWSMVGRLVDARARRGRRLTWAALGVAGVATAVVVVLALAGQSDEDRVAALVRDVAPQTARIEARNQGTRSGLGSGWVLDGGAGLVVTAAHVVNRGDRFFVTADGRESAATVVGVAPCDDLAVLRADSAVGREPLALAGGDAEQGESVLAFGFPETATPGEPASSTRGVVSAASTSFRDPAPDVPAYSDALRTDTALDPGFSGGPLVDLDGRVAGVNAAARRTGADGRPLQGANFAVAADRARRVLGDLRRGRSRAWIGAGFGYPSARDLATRGLPPGLWVQSVVPGTSAARAGLADQYIVAVDGRPMDGTLSGWCRAANGIAPGAAAEVTLATPGAPRRTVRVRFG